MCSGCGEFVDDDTKALQCERCESVEVWKCSKCLGLSDDLYEQLVTSSKSNLYTGFVRNVRKTYSIATRKPPDEVRQLPVAAAYQPR